MCGMYKYVRESFLESLKKRSASLTTRMSAWRKQTVVARAEKPTNPLRARELGYKAKKGFVIVRVRIMRGGHRRPRPNKRRRSKVA